MLNIQPSASNFPVGAECGHPSSVSSNSPPSSISSKKSFTELVNRIGHELSLSKCEKFEDVNYKNLIRIMNEYDSSINPEEWEKFALHDFKRNYTRNGVEEFKEKANLLILVWSPNRGSMIHDHAGAHCVMKVLKGQLTENLYSVPPENENDLNDSNHNHDVGCGNRPCKIERQTKIKANDVAYISDKIGLHRIANESPNEIAVSLHLYTPPYAAKYGCHIFEEGNGKKHLVDMSKLYSWKGVVNDQTTRSSTC